MPLQKTSQLQIIVYNVINEDILTHTSKPDGKATVRFPKKLTGLEDPRRFKNEQIKFKCILHRQ